MGIAVGTGVCVGDVVLADDDIEGAYVVRNCVGTNDCVRDVSVAVAVISLFPSVLVHVNEMETIAAIEHRIIPANRKYVERLLFFESVFS